MSEDPIVAETRVQRQAMMAEAGDTIDSLFVYLQIEQEKYKDRLVRLPPRRLSFPGAKEFIGRKV
jgi:hypothetical protein